MHTVKCNEPCPGPHRIGFHCFCLREIGHPGDCGQAFGPRPPERPAEGR
jgi:hypothetical protein